MDMRAHRMGAWLLAGLAGLGLVACGGGGGGDAPAPASTTVSGTIVKGPVAGATVTLRKADGSACGTATTDAQGRYSLATNCTGDLVVEASGGSYTDEATGRTTPLATPLRVVISATGGTVTGVATPLTTMAYTYAFRNGAGVTRAAFDTQARSLANQLGLAGVDLASTVPQVTGTTNAYGDALRGLSRYLANNGATLATVTSAVFANAADLATFNSLYNQALAQVGSPLRVSFDANGLGISGSGAGGGSGTCGVNARGTVTAGSFVVPVDLDYCVRGIAAGSCSAGNSSLSQVLGAQQGLAGAVNLSYTFGPTCAAGAFSITLQ